jgi:DNA-directed RNA polymerase beta' subunit
MGKRVRYMMRSVITGDNMLKVDEIGVPLSIARSIQIPETVRPYNRDRLNTYYMNKNKIYPGCSGIIKDGTKKLHNINYLDDTYQMQDGDVILRDMITGDVIGFNRQPSLLFSSMSSHKVIVLQKGETLRMNVSACNFYNADFDGDAMNGIVSRNIQARNELSKLSSVGNWMISYQNSAPMVGAFQDALIGMAEFTRSDVYLDKYHAMRMFGQIDPYQKNFNFDKKMYQSRELIKMFLPKINYPKKKAAIYMPQYAPFIKYNPDDTYVQINRGELISGIMDKATIGQGVVGSVLHIINNEYGSDTALDTVYSMQQITTSFFLNYGFTIGISDINISESAVENVKVKAAKMILDSRTITKKLNRNKLIAPIGMSLFEFYEMEQMNALEPGDDFVEPILADIDFASNKLAQLVFTGSKGKPTNVIAINGAIGTQQINGKRMVRQFGWGRTSPYFLRYDMEPKSLGYISNSFREGVSSDIFPFCAAEARHGLINNALSTSITGHQNRLSIKNLESILVDNLYKSTKDQNMIQPLYAESGLDPRRTEKVKFLTVLISDKEMLEYKTKLSDLDPMYRNKNVQSALDDEFKQLIKDRDEYREIFFKIENNNPGNILIDNGHQMPVNIFRIIEDVVYNYKNEIAQLPKSQRILDPIKTINKVLELCRVLPYVYYNETQEKNNMKIPDYIRKSTTLVCILLRSYLCTSNLLNKGITDKLLDIIIVKIRITFKKALIDYGCAVGIIAAQCISEPMTQYVLDSKHRTGGGGGSKTSTIVRIKEILGAKETAKMKNPSMTLVVLEKYETIKIKVQEIANHIEMMDFNRFISATRIFFEEYGKPVHSKYKHEDKQIKEFEKYNLGIDIPNDLTKWCIRFDINKEEMILNSMKLETIITVLRVKLPAIFFVYTPENVDNIVIRCYVRNTITKQGSLNISEAFIIALMQDIRKVVIRGVSGIKSTNVINIVKSFVKDDGSITTHMTYGIETMGSNLEDMLNNQYIDRYKSQTDSVIEFESIFGIEAARNKIINELRKEMSDISKEHCTIYADEMTYSGHVTSIHRTGLQKREMNNVTLRLSFQSPIQVIENAATDGLIDRISGISGPLILGTSPNIGTTYNQTILNEQFIDDYHKNTSNKIDDEL